MDLCITVDLEHDCPPFLTTYRGVTEGMPRLLDLLAREQSVRRVPITAAEVFGEADLINADGDLRTLPCHFTDADSRFAGVDGFYAARLEKL